MSYTVETVKSYNWVWQIVCVKETTDWWGAYWDSASTTVNCFFVPYKSLYQSQLALNWSGSILQTDYYNSHIIPVWWYLAVFLLFLFFFWKLIYNFTLESIKWILSFLTPERK